MAPVMTTMVLVIECCCLCDGHKDKFKNKLRKDIPQIHVEFDTEQSMVTISGAVDPALVRKKLKEHGITILREESSPIHNNHQQKQSERVHRSGSGEQVCQSRSIVRSSGSGVHREQIHRSESKVRRSGVHQDEEVHRKKEVLREQVRRESRKPAGVHFDDFPSEFAGVRIQDESIVKETPDCYLNHEHELVEVESFNKRFTCDGCKEDGFKSRYRCEHCNFDLHRECKFPKRTISPEFDKKLDFEFRPQPPKDRMCDACANEIHGCFYCCKAKGMDLHPCCAGLKAQVHNRDMVLLLCEKVSSECLWCRKKVPPGTKRGNAGWCYLSKCKKYNIHILCITQLLHQAWQGGLMDHTGESSIETVDFQLMAVSERNRGGRGTEALKLISIFRMIVGILLGDPSVFFGSLMVEFLKQLL